MALNPEGLTIAELAELIRQANKGKYGGIEDDELVSSFRASQPDLLDWDNIISEPTLGERLWEDTKSFTKPLWTKGPAVLAQTAYDLASNPKQWALGGISETLTGIQDDAARKIGGKLFGIDLKDRPIMGGSLLNNVKAFAKDYFFDEQSLFSNTTHENNTAGMDENSLNKYWKNKSNFYNLSDAYKTVLAQEDSLGFVPQSGTPGYDKYLEWKDSADSIKTLYQSSINKEKLPPNHLTEGIIERNEISFVDATLGGKIINPDEKESLINNQPYHRWELNYRYNKSDVEKQFNPMRGVWADAIQKFDDSVEADISYQAYQKVKSTEEFWKPGGGDASLWDKKGRDIIVSTGYSALLSVISGATAAFVASRTGMVKNPAILKEVALAPLTFMEHVSANEEAINYLSNDREISLEEYNQIIQAKEKELREKGLKEVKLNNVLKIFKESNFKTTPDGKYILNGMHEGDAVVISAGANYLSTAFTYGVEKKLGMGRIFDKFGKGGRRWVGKSFANNILNKANWSIRGIPGAGNVMKWSEMHKGIIPQFVKEAFVQGGEEVLQTLGQTFTQTAGPMAYKREGFLESVDYSELLESFTGGALLGAGMVGTSNIYTKSGLADRMHNWKLSKSKFDFFQSTVNKLDNGLFGIFVKSPTFETKDDGTVLTDKNGEPIVKSWNLQRDVDSAGKEREFSTFSEAFQFAEQFNRNVKKMLLKESAGTVFKDWANAKTIIKKLKKGKYVVDVIGKNGNVLKTVKFDSAIAATSWKTSEDNFISDIDNVIETEDIKKGKHDKIFTRDDAGNIVNVDEDILFIGGAHGRLTGEAGEAWEAEKGEKDSEDRKKFEKDLNTPDRTLDIIKRKGYDALNDAGLTKQELMQSMKDKGWDELHPEAFEEIDKILTPATQSEEAVDIGTPDEKIITKEDEEAVDIDEEVEVGEEVVEIGEDIAEKEEEYAETPEGEAFGEDIDVDEKYKDMSNDELKKEYLEKKATSKTVKDAFNLTNLKAELKARGLAVPRVTKKVKAKLEKKAPEVTTKQKKEILRQREVQKAADKRGTDDLEAVEILIEGDVEEFGIKHDGTIGVDSMSGELITTNNASNDQLTEILESKLKQIEKFKESHKTKELDRTQMTTLAADLSLAREIKAELTKRGILKPKKKVPTKPAKGKTGYEGFKDEDLVPTLLELRTKGDMASAMESTKVVMELKKRGLPYPKKVSKQRVFDKLLEGEEEVKSSRQLVKEEREEFVRKNAEILQQKFVGPDGKPLFKVVVLEGADQDLPENQTKGWWDEDTNTIYFNPKHFKKDTVFHEFSHPLTRALSNTKGGMELVNKIYNGIINAVDLKGKKVGEEIYNIVMANYVETGDFAEGSYKFKEEVIVFALGWAARDSKIQTELQKSKNPIIQALKRWWNAIKEVLFGKDAPLYVNMYDFVKDGVTFGEMVDFLTDDNVLTIDNLDALSIDNAIENDNITTVEIGSTNDSISQIILTNHFMPLYTEAVIEETNKILESAKRKKAKQQSVTKEQRELNNLHERIRQRLLKKFNIPKSYWGEKRLGKKIKEMQKQVENTLSSVSEVPFNQINTQLKNLFNKLGMSNFANFGLVLPEFTGKEGSVGFNNVQQLGNIIQYQLLQVKFKHLFVENILKKQNKWNIKTIETSISSRKVQLPSKEIKAIKEFLRYFKKNNDALITDNYDTEIFIDEYVAFLDKNYPLYIGEATHQRAGDYVHIDNSLKKDLSQLVPSEELQLIGIGRGEEKGMPSTKVMFYTGSPMEYDHPLHRVYYKDDDLRTKNEGNSVGWYRISPVPYPRYANVFVAMEYQSDFYNKKKGYYNKEIAKYFHNPKLYIEKNFLETGKTDKGLNYNKFSDVLHSLKIALDHNRKYDFDSRVIDSLPDLQKGFKIKWVTGKDYSFVKDIIHKHAILPISELLGERESSVGAISILLEELTESKLLENKIDTIIAWSLVQEYKELSEKVGPKKAWESISDIINNKMVSEVNTTAKTGKEFDKDKSLQNMILSYGEHQEKSKSPAATFRQELFNKIATGKAPKSFYNALISLGKEPIEESQLKRFIDDNIIGTDWIDIRNIANNIIDKYNRKNNISYLKTKHRIYDTNIPLTEEVFNLFMYDLKIAYYSESKEIRKDIFKSPDIRFKTKLIETYKNNTIGFSGKMGFLFSFRRSLKDYLEIQNREASAYQKKLNELSYKLNLFKDKKIINEQLKYYFKTKLLKLVHQGIGTNEFASTIVQTLDNVSDKNSELIEEYKKGNVSIEEVEEWIQDNLDNTLYRTISNLYSLEKPFHKIRVLHSIQYMESKKDPSSTEPVYISLGIANILQQNPYAEDTFNVSKPEIHDFYKTKNEDKWKKIQRIVLDKDGKEIVNYLVNKWKDEKTRREFSQFIKAVLLKTEGGRVKNDIWYGKTDNAKIMQDFILDNIELEYKKQTGKMFKSRDSQFVKQMKKVLDELKNKGIITWDIVVPEWGRASFVEIKVLNRDKLLSYKGSRFQKVLDSEIDDITTPADINGVKDKVKRQISYQKIEDPRLSRNAAINQIFKNAWLDVNTIEKQKTGFKTIINPDYFRIAMLESLPTEDLRDKFIRWFDHNIKFGGLKYMDEAKGKDLDSMLPQESTSSTIIDFFNEVDAREGFLDIIDEIGTDEREISQNDYSYDREFGVHVKSDDAVKYNKEAFNILRDDNIAPKDKFNEWVKFVSSKIKKRLYTLDQKRKQLKKFNRLFSTVAINTALGKYNERNQFYAIVTSTESIYDEKGNWIGSFATGFKFELKGPESKVIRGSSNISTAKITPFELNNQKGLFSWVDGSDFLVNAILKDEDANNLKEEIIDRDTGKKITINKRGLKERYNFFSYDELINLNEEIKSSGYTIAMSRGDSNKLALVKIESSHKEKALNFDSWFEGEFDDGFIPSESKDIHKANMKKGHIDANIAVHEALKQVFPDYLSLDAATFAKRFKLPFTPLTISQSMPNVTMYVAKKEDLVFKYREKTNDGYQTVETVGNLYIGDGGSITARQLFEKFEIHHGLNKNQAKAKTVIYRNQDGEGIAIKHQHYQPEAFIEIWEGDKLIAKVDKNGNFSEGAAAGMDMIVTDDEAKWMFGGIGVGSKVEITGRDIGFTKYSDDKISKDANHMMQWYNFIYDPKMIQAFKDYMLGDMQNKLKEAFRDFSDTNLKSSAKRISDIIKKVDVNDAMGFRNTMIGLNELGVVWQLEPMLNVLYQNKKITPALRFKNQPGAKVDLVPNLRGDLKPGEAALSKHNAEEVYLKYAAFKGIKLKDAKRTKLSTINKWLAEEKVNMFIARSPVPHAGGAMLVRIKRLHTRNGLVELNPFDVFARLEGDYDGDWISMEMLPWTYDYRRNVLPPQTKKFIEIEGEDAAMMYDTGDTNTMMKVLNNLNIEISKLFEETNIPFPISNWHAEFITERDKQLIITYAPKSITPKVVELLEEKSKLEETIIDIKGEERVREELQIAEYEAKQGIESFEVERKTFISPMEDAVKKFFEGKEVRGINLADFNNDLGKLNMSSMEDRFTLIEAMTYNKQGEITNVIAIHGLLFNTINSISLAGVGNIVLKQPNENVTFNVGKIDGKPSKWTVSEILRIYLQAAVDNSKFMLLQQWGYTQDNLFRALFKYAPGHPQAGETITAGHYNEIKPYINFLKKATNIMRGRDFTYGNYNTTRTIEESSKYYDYKQDKNEYIKRLGERVNRKTGEVTEFRKINIAVNFKEDVSTPIEEIAMTPHLEFEIWRNKFNIIGAEGWPGRLHFNVHRNAHIAAAAHINSKSIVTNSLNQAVKRDEKAGIITGKKSEWAKKEAKEGEAYAKIMSDGFYLLMRYSLVNNNPSFFEKNDKATKWKEMFDKKYEKLSETAKLAATYHFLNGQATKWDDFDVIAPRWLPPANKDSAEFQLLDEKLLTKFVEAYNNEVTNHRNMNSRFTTNDDLILEDFIEEQCG